MSRDRKQNERAVLNMLNFLREVYKLSDEGKLKTITWLTDKHEVSHNAGIACKELKILVVEDGLYKWAVKGEPGRYMALQILDNLLDRSKKKVSVPIFPDMVALADKIVEKLDVLAVQNESSLRASKGRLLSRALPQASMMGNGLFGEVESKQSVKLDIMKAIANGVYDGVQHTTDKEDAITIHTNNAFIIQATEDLYNQFYGVKSQLKAV